MEAKSPNKDVLRARACVDRMGKGKGGTKIRHQNTYTFYLSISSFLTVCVCVCSQWALHICITAQYTMYKQIYIVY